ncbi:MAG TPA: ferredoxin [Acidimicrobiales bacterium]|nr:ferredoxin [Acidimicrobiales bacterium]
MSGESGWHLALDADRCDGHGICALLCPDRIGLDRWGYASVSPEPLGGRRALARARRAVSGCPASALRLVGGTGAVREPGRAGKIGRMNPGAP